MRIWWDAFSEIQLREHLIGLSSEHHVIAPDERTIRDFPADVSFTYSLTPPTDFDSAKTILLLFRPDEEELTSFYSDHPRVLNVVSVGTELLPRLVCRSREIPSLPVARYAIFSNPRCGSTYFSRLCNLNGLARPLEHIRDPVLYSLRYGAAPHLLLHNILRYGTVDGLFGTKIISHFLSELIALPHAKEAFVSWLQQDFQLIYITREPEDSAVSYYIATVTNNWTSDSFDVEKTLISHKVDEARLFAIYRWLTAEADTLHRFLYPRFADRTHRIPYSELLNSAALTKHLQEIFNIPISCQVTTGGRRSGSLAILYNRVRDCLRRAL